MITYVKGDLFAANERIIAHGCNCQGKMGAGVAKLVADKYPTAFAMYQLAVQYGEFYPGVAQPVPCKGDSGDNDWVTVYNLATQDLPGPHATFEFVQAAFENMRRHMIFVGENEVAMPLIGAGIGGLDWMYIHRILIPLFAIGCIVKVYYLDDAALPEALRES